MLIEVYADGSGNTFDSDGGYGWRICVDGTFHSEGSGYLVSATNNVAELTAAIKGLEAAKILLGQHQVQQTGPHQVSLVCDAQLVLGYASGRYQCKALHLAPLYIKVKALYKELGANGRWVKGHSGDEHNEACDKLAKAARLGKGTDSGSSQRLPGTLPGDGEDR